MRAQPEAIKPMCLTVTASYPVAPEWRLKPSAHCCRFIRFLQGGGGLHTEALAKMRWWRCVVSTVREPLVLALWGS